MVRELLARARDEQLAMVAAALEQDADPSDNESDALLGRLWHWLSTPERRPRCG